MAPATVTLDNMNPCIKKMEYAVRGPLVIRATAIEKVKQFLVSVIFFERRKYLGNSSWSQETIP